MGKYATFEEELDAIREALYEETKDMTTEEHVAYIRAMAEPVIQEFGLKRSTLKPVKPFSQPE